MHDTQHCCSEQLFSYGTLQLETVQLATFGRLLQGSLERLPGYVLVPLAITDAQVIATSGHTQHPIARHTGLPTDAVQGSVFLVTPDELALADHYEVAAYQRVAVTLASGLQAWVYAEISGHGLLVNEVTPSSKAGT
jgi:hypothetical protein